MPQQSIKRKIESGVMGRFRKRLELAYFIVHEEGFRVVRRLPERKLPFSRSQATHIVVPLTHREKRSVDLTKRPPGINLVGYFTGNFGTATSARAFSHAVQLTGVPFVLSNLVAEQYAQQEFDVDFSDHDPYSVNLLHLNPDSLEEVLKSKGDAFLRGRYNVGIWYWESEKFPERWRSAFHLIDEIWVTSSFTQKSIQAVSHVPVTRMTYPLIVDTSIIEPEIRRRFSVKDDEFMFLFTFNFRASSKGKILSLCCKRLGLHFEIASESD